EQRISNQYSFRIELLDLCGGQPELPENHFVAFPEHVGFQVSRRFPVREPRRVTGNRERSDLRIEDLPHSTALAKMREPHRLVERQYGTAGYAVAFEGSDGGIPRRELPQPFLDDGHDLRIVVAPCMRGGEFRIAGELRTAERFRELRPLVRENIDGDELVTPPAENTHGRARAALVRGA